MRRVALLVLAALALGAGADLLMACSDYPHSEGTAHPLADYARGAFAVRPEAAPGLFERNAAFLLGRT